MMRLGSLASRADTCLDVMNLISGIRARTELMSCSGARMNTMPGFAEYHYELVRVVCVRKRVVSIRFCYVHTCMHGVCMYVIVCMYLCMYSRTMHSS